MKIFFGGIIQGSCRGRDINPQDYRATLKTLILRHDPQADIVDPFASHKDSVEYDDDKARDTFCKHIDIVKNVDLLIAWLPTASMGTAIEMWVARDNNVPIITISPMTTNWVIRILSRKNFETVESFARFLESDGLASFIDNAKSGLAEASLKEST
jgi:hypothetical protein